MRNDSGDDERRAGGTLTKLRRANERGAHGWKSNELSLACKLQLATSGTHLLMIHLDTSSGARVPVRISAPPWEARLSVCQFSVTRPPQWQCGMCAGGSQGQQERRVPSGGGEEEKRIRLISCESKGAAHTSALLEDAATSSTSSTFASLAHYSAHPPCSYGQLATRAYLRASSRSRPRVQLSI